ncbi:unnamed protein product [Amaranthus hypochondriacus]
MVVSDSRRETDLHGERIVEREHGCPQHLVVDEKGIGLVVMSGNGDEHLRSFQGYPLRDDDASSRFQWTHLLKGSGSKVVNCEKKGLQDSVSAPYGRRYDGLVEKSKPIDGETISNLPDYDCNGGRAKCREVTRNVTGSADDSEYPRPIRNLTEHPAEDSEYISIRNVTGPPAEASEYRLIKNVTGRLADDSEYHRPIRNVTDRSAEDREYGRPMRNVTDLSTEDLRQTRNISGLSNGDSNYNGCTKNMTDYSTEYDECARKVTNHPLEDGEYPRCVRTGHLIDEAAYQRHTKSVTGCFVEDDGRIRRREYPQHMNRQSSRNTHEKGYCLRSRNDDSSPCLTPHSQSNDRNNSFRRTSYTEYEGPHPKIFHHQLDCRATDDCISPSSCCGAHGMLYSKARTNARHIPSEDFSSRKAKYNQNYAEYIYPANPNSGKLNRMALSEDIYDKYEDVAYYSGRGDASETGVVDPSLTTYGFISNSRECAFEENELHSFNHTLQEAPNVDMNDFNRTAHEIDYGGVHLETMNRYLEYETMATHDKEYLYQSDELGYVVSHEDQTWNHPLSDDRALYVDENQQHRSESGDVNLRDQLSKHHKRKRGFVDNTNWSKHRTSTLGGRGALSYDNAEPDDEFVHPNKRSSHHIQSKKNAGMSKSDHRLSFGGLSKELQSRLSKPCESESNALKNRLKRNCFAPRILKPQSSKFLNGNGNRVRNLNVGHSTSAPRASGKAKPTHIKKRLKPAHHRDVSPSDPQASQLGLNLESQLKLTTKNPESTKEAGLFQVADLDQPILKVKPAEKDPPENSLELKCQVDNWFLKCILFLNGNPGRQKKFKELGSGVTLKCIICSSYKEFIQTKDVAMHAFTSLKVGLRAPHLGFHRALCVLMGWDPSAQSNGRWICKSLPDVEACSSKEDIILWPPVLIVHNGSPKASYNNEQGKISIGQLENILRDMGLSEGNTRICHGKSGNSNIFLVKFNATFSGMQEAERLNNVFAEKKHGRAELKEIDAGAECSEGVFQDKIEDALYGYLGIVEDFDKLSYDMRRHYVAKSKKDILAHVQTAI